MASQTVNGSTSYVLRPDSFSNDALAHYRITHPDKLLKYATKALHESGHLPAGLYDVVAPPTPAEPIKTDEERSETPEQAAERTLKAKEAEAVKVLEGEEQAKQEAQAYKEDMARLELVRVKRMIMKNLAQRAKGEVEVQRCMKETEETVERTESVRAQVQEHYKLLERMKRDKEGKMRAAAIVDQIKAKKMSKADLQAKIDTLRTSIDAHKQVKESLAAVARDRHAKFAEASRLIDEARALELPTLTPPGEIEVISVEDAPKKATNEDKAAGLTSMNVPSGSKLTATTLPFTPGTSGPSTGSTSNRISRSTSQPSSRAGTPARQTPTGPSGSAISAAGPASGPESSGRQNNTPQRPSHLPSRPSAPANASTSSRVPNLPARPTSLRTVTGPAGTGPSSSSVEEGELPDERRTTDVRGTGAVSMRQGDGKDAGAGAGTRSSAASRETRELGGASVSGGRGTKRAPGGEGDRGGRPLTRGRRG